MSPDEQKEHYDQMLQGYQIFLIAACDDLNLFYLSDSQIAKEIISKCKLKKEQLTSPKMEQCLSFYESMKEDEPESKLVIFTRFERMAQLIHQQMPGSVMYTGKMTNAAKEYAVEQFKTNPDVKCFIATDAGSTGLNLQVANYMIHFDLPWDPTLIEQRNGRIDRTGSAFDHVTIYYYVMSESYDEQLLKILQRKSDLADQIISGQKQSFGQTNPNQIAIEKLLKQKSKNINL
jgi:SNF2 family DNA or RNA helicase